MILGLTRASQCENLECSATFFVGNEGPIYALKGYTYIYIYIVYIYIVYIYIYIYIWGLLPSFPTKSHGEQVDKLFKWASDREERLSRLRKEKEEQLEAVGGSPGSKIRRNRV